MYIKGAFIEKCIFYIKACNIDIYKEAKYVQNAFDEIEWGA